MIEDTRTQLSRILNGIFNHINTIGSYINPQRDLNSFQNSNLTIERFGNNSREIRDTK